MGKILASRSLQQIWRSCDRVSWKNSYNKTKIDALISQKFLFWNETLHVSDSSSVHHQEFSTVHTAMVYVIQVFWHIPLLCLQWKTPDDEQRNCPKHVVSFQNKNIWEISASRWFCCKKSLQQLAIPILGLHITQYNFCLAYLNILTYLAGHGSKILNLMTSMISQAWHQL